MPSVTIWNTLSDPPAIATRREITGWTTPVGDASPEPIYSDPVPLERLTAAIWTRPRWNATMRADPASHGAANFDAGERILTVIDVRPTLGEYDRLGARGAGVPDLDAGTMTYTWAKISAASFDPATHHAPVWTGSAWADPVAKSLALLKAEKTAAITERRWAVETGGITLNGAAIATDAATQAKLSGALQLVQDDDTRILDWKGVNGWITLDATAVTAIAVAVGLHVQACFTREKDMLAAVTAAETTAALALVDPQAGTIDGAGGWPT
jgi:hypothetical protein